MRYNNSQQYKNANKSVVSNFLGLKSSPDRDGRYFTTDERDARLIAANLRKREYEQYKQQYQRQSASPFYVLQQFEYNRKKISR